MNDIDDVLINLKIKRFLTQYDYLELELEETQYIFDKYNKQFVKDYYDVDLPPKATIVLPTEINENDELPSEYNDTEDLEDDKLQEYIQLKKLYKLLSLKTHPDKNKGNKEEFYQINKAYKEKNILKLFKFCIKYNIEVNSLIVNKCILLFEQNITDMQNKIYNLKQSLAWKWCNATDEERDEFKKANIV
jgi:hypothetical protein